MTINYGVNAPIRLTGAVHASALTGYVRSPLFVAYQDRVQVAAAGAINDTIVLGDVDWEFIPDATLSTITFDDAGTNATTLDIGDVTTGNSLASALDIATAAGTASIFAAIDRANFGKTMWQLLGYSTLAAARLVGERARIIATIKGGATTLAMDLFWKFIGTKA